MNLSQAFREEGRSGTSGRATRTVRRLLVASQVAFAFMLLIGAGLLLASFQRVLAIDPGSSRNDVLTARVSPPPARYKDDADAADVRRDRLLERVRSSRASSRPDIVTNIPFGGDFSDSVILAEGYQMKPGESLISPYSVNATPGYFEAMGIPLVEGAPVQRGRHARVAEGHHRGREARPALLGPHQPDRQAPVQAG